MKAITFNLRLLQPVLATQPESGEENSSTSFGFVPGSMIRGALIRRYLGERSSEQLLQDAQARRLFLDGPVCFLNAYPYHPTHKRRMLPRPLTWLIAKDDADNPEAKVFDFAVQVNDELGNSKNPKGDFCSRRDHQIELRSAGIQIMVHNASDDPNRKDADVSTVYRYEALAAGEVLAGAIIAEDEKDLNLLQPILQGEFVLGGSHTAGYGCVKIEDVISPQEWHEYERDTDLSDKVIITLLSDALVRGRTGQIDGDLNIALGIPDSGNKKIFRRFRLVGGFNRKAGLPLVQEWALQAGSVFVCPADALDPAKLNALVERGIGERKAEGFGRIAVNWFTEKSFTRHAFSEASEPPETFMLSTGSAEIVKRMAQHQLRAQLEQRLVWAVNRARLNDRLPQNAQLSRVRTAAQQALLKKNLSDLSDLLEGLKGAREQFERARVKEEPMLDWLRARVTYLDIQTQLGIGDELPRVGGESAEITDTLAVEYTARLIDGVMKKAIKQNQDRARGTR